MSKYIDIKALLDFPIRANRCDKANADKNFIYGIESVIEYAENLSAADVAPVRHGYWTTTDTLLGRCCVCSVCGSCPDMEYKYCPYCGSLMDGGADNGERKTAD